jgi:hypothetical protein
MMIEIGMGIGRLGVMIQVVSAQGKEVRECWRVLQLA